MLIIRTINILKLAIKRCLSRSPKLYSRAEKALSYIHIRHINKDKLKSIQSIEQQVQNATKGKINNSAPVILMNVSSVRLIQLSYNAATELLIGWSLRLSGKRVIYYSCQASLPHCRVGTEYAKPYENPPCNICVAMSRNIYPLSHCTSWSEWPNSYDSDLLEWFEIIEKYRLTELKEIYFEGLPLGYLVWPTLKRALRLGNPEKDPAASWYMSRYIVGAAQLARHFRGLIEKERPAAVVVFNGVFYPEAVVSTIARQQGIRTITYETGHREGSIFFSHDQATKYEVYVPDDFVFGKAENIELDNYLVKRFRGDFKMGGERFWKDMKGIDKNIIKKMDQFNQVVTIFTNVIFDTSQQHSNTCFKDMFDWLETTIQIASQHIDKLFIIRAHPADVIRKGKVSREAVSEWLKGSGWSDLSNIIFIAPNYYISSYELIKLSKFVIVYNSHIGLEALILGKTVVAGGLSGYNNCGAVIYQKTPAEYRKNVSDLLASPEIKKNEEQIKLARRQFYYYLFKSCIYLEKFLGKDVSVSKINLNHIDELRPENSTEMRSILHGILTGGDFKNESKVIS